MVVFNLRAQTIRSGLPILQMTQVSKGAQPIVGSLSVTGKGQHANEKLADGIQKSHLESTGTSFERRLYPPAAFRSASFDHPTVACTFLMLATSLRCVSLIYRRTAPVHA